MQKCYIFLFVCEKRTSQSTKLKKDIGERVIALESTKILKKSQKFEYGVRNEYHFWILVIQHAFHLFKHLPQ